MTPADHGYIRCIRCGTWRQPEWLTWDEHDASRRWCQDVAWCSAQAGQGKGAMEADTGRPERNGCRTMRGQGRTFRERHGAARGLAAEWARSCSVDRLT